MLHVSIREQLPFIVQLFKDKRIKSVYAFGSVVSESFNEDSDIDLLIHFEDGIDPLKKGETCWELHDVLRERFNREIDIVVEGTLKNPYFIEELNEKKELVYAA